jgi:hypothetical protein
MTDGSITEFRKATMVYDGRLTPINPDYWEELAINTFSLQQRTMFNLPLIFD